MDCDKAKTWDTAIFQPPFQGGLALSSREFIFQSRRTLYYTTTTPFNIGLTLEGVLPISYVKFGFTLGQSQSNYNLYGTPIAIFSIINGETTTDVAGVKYPFDDRYFKIMTDFEAGTISFAQSSDAVTVGDNTDSTQFGPWETLLTI